jgi:phosphatidate cytidylyltransferase
MLRWRLLLGTLIIAALVGLCWLDSRATVPGVWLFPIVIAATVLATKEVLDLLAAAGMRPMSLIVYLANLLFVVSVWIFMCRELTGFCPDVCGFFLCNSQLEIVPPMFAIVIAEMWRYRKPGSAAVNVAGGLFAFVYVALMLKSALVLRMVWGVGALASWIIVVKMGDTGAYAAGRLFGRHKLAPLISPGKTIEGGLGGLACSCLGSWLTFRWLIPGCTGKTISGGPWWGWLVFGLLVGGAGMLGDLAESLLKRDVGRKDSSDWLPGFGGVLDILDSLLLSAPVAWFCWASGLVGHF